MCCVCALIGNSRLSKLTTAKVALPTFLDCKSAFSKCCVVSSLFLLMDWIFFSNGYISKEKITGIEILSEFAVRFAFVWAIALVVLIIMDLIIKFGKNNKYQMKSALSLVIFRTVWCFILAFIIA